MMREIAELAGRIAELERRVFGMMRHGTVAQVDASKGRVRLKLGASSAGGDFLGPWVPYAQQAGGLKIHTPPTVGQQMTIASPSGDWRQAVALPFTWSQDNPSPSKSGDENVLTFGDVEIKIAGGLVGAKVGDASLLLQDGLARLKSGGSAVKVRPNGISFDGDVSGIKGDNGSPGAPGPAGEGVTRYDVVVPTGAWVIHHGLGRVPLVGVYLDTGEAVIGDVVADIENVNVSFATPTSGFALIA